MTNDLRARLRPRQNMSSLASKLAEALLLLDRWMLSLGRSTCDPGAELPIREDGQTTADNNGLAWKVLVEKFASEAEMTFDVANATLRASYLTLLALRQQLVDAWTCGATSPPQPEFDALKHFAMEKCGYSAGDAWAHARQLHRAYCTTAHCPLKRPASTFTAA